MAATTSATPKIDGKEYVELTDREHVLLRPTNYMTETKRFERETWVYDDDLKKIVKKTITYPPAITHLFGEILSNAGDNIDRSKRENFPHGKIEVEMDMHTISVKNGGRPIAVTINEKTGVYNPEMIFGRMKTSSAYTNSEYESAGMNGLGAKLTNIFSSSFEVIVKDSYNHKSFYGKWSNNMLDYSGSEVANYKGKDSSVEVKYTLDFSKFENVDSYDDEALSIIMKMIFFVSCTNKVPVVFNGVEYNYIDTRELLKLVWSEEIIEKSISYYEWIIPPEGSEDLTSPKRPKKKGDSPTNISLNIKKKINWNKAIASIELFYFDTPDNGDTLTFVNGINCTQGIHITEAYSKFSQIVIPNIKKAAQANIKLSAKDIKNHVSLFMILKLKAPQFVGNMKDKLSYALNKPKITLDSESVMKRVNKWKLIQRLNQEVKAMDFEILRETDGVGKEMAYFGKKGADANYACYPEESPNCVLNLSEGESAGLYMDKRIHFTGGKNYNGILCLKGKVLNVTNATANKIKENEELCIIKKMLNLEEGTDYTIPENKKKLKYGLIVIATDADDDGKHIAALIINYFKERFPSLLKLGMVAYLRLPIVKVFDKRGNVLRDFFSSRVYDEWLNSDDESIVKERSRIGKTKYYKGLASYKDKEVAEDVETCGTYKIIEDDTDESGEILKMAFDVRQVEKRKEWIKKWRTIIQSEELEIVSYAEFRDDITKLKGEQSVKSFFENRWVDYSMSNIIRGIPSLYDGLKRVQRKIMYTALKVFGKKNEELKVADFASQTSTLTNYHHNSKALEDAIARMMQSFVGTNNLPLLQTEGQCGSRKEGPSVFGAPRYLFVKLAEITPLIFNQDLIEMVPQVFDEGKYVETEWLPSIIPMVLVNGCNGIGTGNSTFVPNHNPLDVIDNLMRMCRGEDPKELIPFYRNFQGKIKIGVSKKNQKDDEIRKLYQKINMDSDSTFDGIEEKTDSRSEDEEDLSKEYDYEKEFDDLGKLSMITEGVYSIEYVKKKITKKNKIDMDDVPIGEITVSELPIGKWTLNYYSSMMKYKELGIIEDANDISSEFDDTVGFRIFGWKGPKLSKNGIQHLKLTTRFPLTNMTLIDLEGNPIHFQNQIAILKAFYGNMIVIFDKYKAHTVSSIQEKIDLNENKMKFIDCVLKGDIIIFVPGKTPKSQKRRKEIEIVDDMTSFGIKNPNSIFRATKFSDVTEEEYQSLFEEIEILKKEKESLVAKTPQMLWIERLEKLRRYIVAEGDFN